MMSHYDITLLLLMYDLVRDMGGGYLKANHCAVQNGYECHF